MRIAISVFFLLLTYACTSGEPTYNVENTVEENQDSSVYYTKEFYFPTEELKEGKVYKYVLVHEEEEYFSHYWHLKSETDEQGNLFLNWKRYNQSFEQDQYIKEWVIKDGVITKEYAFFVKDSVSEEMKEYPNTVSQNVVFPFYASKDSVMAYRFECEMKLPPDFLTVKLVRDRKFKQEVNYQYNDKEVEAIAFISQDFYDIENTTGGGFWNQKRAVVEVYAKGIGLVFQEEKTAGAEGTEITKLSKIYTIEEFENLQREIKGE